MLASESVSASVERIDIKKSKDDIAVLQVTFLIGTITQKKAISCNLLIQLQISLSIWMAIASV